MIYALTKNKKKIASYDAIKGEMYFCPCCGGELILKSGKTNIIHFAHKNLLDCDIFESDMSEWHINWQNKFPIENREVVIKHTFDVEDSFIKNNGLIAGKEYAHRADVCIGKYIIEFQHSTISKEQFDFRNYFYSQCGYKVIWIFDFRDEFRCKRMECYDEWNKSYDNGGIWKWSYPAKFLSNVVPQFNKNIKIFFQVADNSDDECNCIEMVTWAICNYNSADFKRFYTSYKITNYMELYDSLINNKL